MGTDTESVRLKININVSEEHKVFLWLPAKTASEHAVTVFSLFSFENFVCDYSRKNIENYHGIVRHNHGLNLFEGHENYKLICTARNPLKRLLSAYVYSNRIYKNLSVKGFRNFFIRTISEPNNAWLSASGSFSRIPDYFIRQENLYEDYLKIPFIKESKVATCGVLEELCNKKINQTEHHNLDIKECYTKDMIDYIYTEYRWYFDTLGYSPEV